MVLALTLTLLDLQPQPTETCAQLRYFVAFKFDSQEIRCRELLMPYLAKFHPSEHPIAQTLQVKTIVKVFSVDSEGHEILESVGRRSFEFAEDNAEADIQFGINLFKVKIRIKHKYENDMTEPNASETLTLQRYCTGSNRFNRNKRLEESDGQETACVGESQSNISEFDSASRCSEFSQEIKLNEERLIGEQLILERRQNQSLQRKIKSQAGKIKCMKKSLGSQKELIQCYISKFAKFVERLETNSKGQHIIHIDEKKHELAIRYKSNSNFEDCFREFVSFMTKQISDRSTKNTDPCKAINLHEHQQTDLESTLDELNTEVRALQEGIRCKDIEIDSLRASILSLEADMQAVCQMNDYLETQQKSKQQQLETANRNILGLSKALEDTKLEMGAVELANEKLVKQLNNLRLEIQENEEQIWDLTESLESYQKKYGGLKTVKDRAIELEIKECLIWIDQKDREKQEHIDQNYLIPVQRSELEGAGHYTHSTQLI